MDQLLTPTDVSNFLGVPVATLAAWRLRRSGPAPIKVGKHVRYRRADVEAWIDRQTQEGVRSA